MAIPPRHECTGLPGPFSVVPREFLSSLDGREAFYCLSRGNCMKTKLLYHTNSFTYECTAKVVAVEGDDIALDATIFYPGGGGQMPDRGMITWDNQEEQ